MSEMAERTVGRHAKQEEERARKRRRLLLLPFWGAESTWARRIAGFLAWTLALAIPAGVGYAGWSTSGNGDGAAKATSVAGLEVSAGSAVGQLYPGASGDVQFRVKNPNPYPVSVTGWTGANVRGTTDNANCGKDYFSLTGGTLATTSIPSGATVTVTVAGAVTMSDQAPDACQGVGVTVNATLVAAQS